MSWAPVAAVVPAISRWIQRYLFRWRKCPTCGDLFPRSYYRIHMHFTYLGTKAEFDPGPYEDGTWNFVERGA